MQNRVIWRIKRKNGLTSRLSRLVSHDWSTKKCSKFRTGGVYISPIWEAKASGRIKPNFFDGRRPQRNRAIFGDDQFRGFGLAEGQTLPFPIDFEDRPYNTHTTV